MDKSNAHSSSRATKAYTEKELDKYLFLLGIHPELSTAEIKAVFSAQKISFKIESTTGKNLILSTNKELNAEKLMHRLGGTIKIAKMIGQEKTVNAIVDFLINTQKEGKIQFSLTGGNYKEPLTIKKLLKEKGRSVRYVEIKNTASILHNSLVKKKGDLTIVNENIFVTLAIQPIEELSKRDFDRPGADSFSGMLPPKLARMMINLTETDFNATILDAFCGSGTVLTEAIAMGYTNIYGSDISEKAIQDTTDNVKWIIKEKNIKEIKKSIFLSDATQLDKKIKTNTINAIISEPYMGKPLHGNESEKYLLKQTKELTKLYIDAFTVFHKILKKNGCVVFIIPTFKFNNSWIKINCVEKIKQIGFNVESLSEKTTFLRYRRENQHLARDIWKFVKNIT